jgi:carboxypeptidase C (cathepsin A)
VDRINKSLIGISSLLLTVFVLGAPCRADAAASEDAAPERASVEIETASAELSSVINGVVVKYTVNAGLTALYDDSGKETGSIFSTSYIAEAQDGENRPVAFIFNGGPGSASTCLHVGAFGPKVFPDIGNGGLDVPIPPYSLEDNEESPLDIADLVFIDPIGTGFSRAAERDSGDPSDKSPSESDSLPASPSDPKANAPFWGVEEDLESLAEFVRIWLSENKRWGAKIFII